MQRRHLGEQRIRDLDDRPGDVGDRRPHVGRAGRRAEHRGDSCGGRSRRQLDRHRADLRVGSFGRGRRARGEAVAGVAPAADLHEVRAGRRQRRAESSAAAAEVAAECDASLRRLGVDRIDLYQLHWPAPQPIAETAAACAALLKAGKIRAIGVSNFSVPQLEEWRATGVPLHSDQPPYSILRPAVKQDVLPWCAAHDVGAISYSPLFRGLLFGTWSRDKTFAADDGREHAQGLRGRAVSAPPAGGRRDPGGWRRAAA